MYTPEGEYTEKEFTESAEHLDNGTSEDKNTEQLDKEVSEGKNTEQIDKEVSVSENAEHLDDDVGMLRTDGNSRKVKMTEKGKEWKLQVLQGRFRSSTIKWQRHVSDMMVLLSDSDDISIIRQNRGKLTECFNGVSLVFEELYYLDAETPLSAKFDAIADEHKVVMSQISDVIRSINLEKGSTRSKQSSLRSSKHSAASGSSQTLKFSIAADAAGLKTRLKFVDAESKARANLERLGIEKELGVANAKLEVINSMEQYPSDMFETDNLPGEIDKTDFVKNYIESQNRQVRVDLEPKTTHCPIEPKEEIKNFIPNPNTHIDLEPKTTHFPLEPKVEIKNYIPNPNAPDFVPSHFNETVLHQTVDTDSTKLQHSLLDLTRSLADQVTLNRLPPPEPNIFFGDPIQYPAWKLAFQTLIEQRKLPDGEKIHYLKKYLGGPVLQVVENYFLMSSGDAFNEAKQLLDERFGDPFIIAGAFRDKLEAWPKVVARDPKGLLKFADFLKQCLAASREYSSLGVLSDCRENRKMLSKLPEWLITRWNRVVVQTKKDKEEFPSFKVFVEFICNEAKIANDPVTSVQSVKSVGFEDNKPVKGFHRNRFASDKTVGGRSLLIGTDDSSPKFVKAKPLTCHLCEKNHDIDTCRTFLGKSLADRKRFVADKKLCFGCLKLGHISRECRNRKKCKACGKSHPSSLHGDVKPQMNGSQASAFEKSKNNETQGSFSGSTSLNGVYAASKCSMILPVFVSHCDDPCNERLVYALLDTQSDTTFILDKTCKALGISGTHANLSLSTMHAENKVVETQRIKGLMVRGFDSESKILLPITYTRDIMPANRSHIPTPELVKSWPHLSLVAKQLCPVQDCEIGLLIGYNCPKALIPREVVAPTGDGPFGQKTDLGWGIVGIVDHCCSENDSIGSSHRILSREVPPDITGNERTGSSSVLFSVRTSVKEIVTDEVLKLLEQDFRDSRASSKTLSQQDQRFMALLEEGITFKDGHYEMPLPFVGKEPLLPNNKSTALKRLNQLRKRLDKDKLLCHHYADFMRDLIDSGHAERVSKKDSNEDGKVWYIPHHGVYHPHKPDKIRVVFDCSASFQGACLNSCLLQGPDLINSLVGVLCRFRKEPIAIMCDVEKMFHQFKVNIKHRNYLRFLWWENADMSNDPVEYRMTVHLFGAKSSPGCANFGLKKMALDHEDEFGAEVADFICRDFYVDDGLRSLPTASKAVELVKNTKAMCNKAGLRLHKFVSNSKEALEHLPQDDLAKNLKNIDLSHDSLPIERALGISWCVESDTFQFHLTLSDTPLTRRGIMSTISSIYDPLGLIAPVVLVGKRILQQLCTDRADWDDPVPDRLKADWAKWRESLLSLDKLQITRCIKPEGLVHIKHKELHHFSDASSVGYGQCSYLRVVNEEGRVHCALIFAKSRVAPLKIVTIPRLELTAALLSVRNSLMLEREMEYNDVKHFYWTDSQVVLGYISNESRRFHVFVANRVQEIRNETHVDQWNYVASGDNPADVASRGLFANEFVDNQMWFRGPEFLWKPKLQIAEVNPTSISLDDPELRRVHSFATHTDQSDGGFLLDRIQYFSDWNRAKRAIALCLRFKAKLVSRSIKKPKVPLQRETALAQFTPVTVQELQFAEDEIFRLVQLHYFHSEIATLKAKGIIGYPSHRKEKRTRKMILKVSPLYHLDPFLDSNQVLRVGGRVQHSDLSEALKYPILLPKESHVTNLVVSHFHEKVQHQGREMTSKWHLDIIL